MFSVALFPYSQKMGFTHRKEFSEEVCVGYKMQISISIDESTICLGDRK